jgi:hypothetical protein
MFPSNQDLITFYFRWDRHAEKETYPKICVFVSYTYLSDPHQFTAMD